MAAEGGLIEPLKATLLRRRRRLYRAAISGEGVGVWGRGVPSPMGWRCGGGVLPAPQKIFEFKLYTDMSFLCIVLVKIEYAGGMPYRLYKSIHCNITVLCCK